jgi:hypothetical protein
MKKNYFIRIQNSTRLYKITPFIQRQQRMFWERVSSLSQSKV